MYCHRGYVVAELDPETMTFRILAHGEPDPAFTGRLLRRADRQGPLARRPGSFRADRIAWRNLPYQVDDSVSHLSRNMNKRRDGASTSIVSD
jgi:hypothetical protein